LMGAVVGFVAIALVSAMYGIYRQVKVAEILPFVSVWISHFQALR
jgi:hypothetical protein